MPSGGWIQRRVQLGSARRYIHACFFFLSLFFTRTNQIYSGLSYTLERVNESIYAQASGRQQLAMRKHLLFCSRERMRFSLYTGKIHRAGILKYEDRKKKVTSFSLEESRSFETLCFRLMWTLKGLSCYTLRALHQYPFGLKSFGICENNSLCDSNHNFLCLQIFRVRQNVNASKFWVNFSIHLFRSLSIFIYNRILMNPFEIGASCLGEWHERCWNFLMMRLSCYLTVCSSVIFDSVLVTHSRNSRPSATAIISRLIFRRTVSNYGNLLNKVRDGSS